jgi:hypothetical protein
MTGRTTFIDGLLAEVSWGFSSTVRQMPGHLCTAPVSFHYNPYHWSTDVADVTLGASGLWLGTRTGTGGTAH